MIVSEPDWLLMFNDFFRYNNDTDAQAIWDQYASKHNFTDGIPKEFLFVKLNPDISDQRRNFIANGIRNYF